MRERIWLGLRNSGLLRRLYRIPALAPIMKSASLLVLPSTTEKYLEIRSGPGKGLRLELNPRWEFGLWEGTFENSMQRAAQKYLGPCKILYDVEGAGASTAFSPRAEARALLLSNRTPTIWNGFTGIFA